MASIANSKTSSQRPHAIIVWQGHFYLLGVYGLVVLATLMWSEKNGHRIKPLLGLSA
jgi:hypothetical protein